MKPKPLSLFFLVLYIGFAFNGLLFANDVYHSATQTYGPPKCDNLSFYAGMPMPLSGRPEVYVENYENVPIFVHYEFRICTEDGLCGTSFAKDHTVPPKGKYLHEYVLYQNVKYTKTGDYHYTVFVDITGDITEHTRKTCGIHVWNDDLV